jgi:HSP20 family protein
MAIERWRPWEEFRGMERMMDEVLRHPLASWRRPLTWWRVPTEELGWMPGVEVYEKADKFVVRAELPGMKKEEIDVSVVGDTLTISGERKAESEVKDEDYYRCELCYGKFSRSVGLPTAVNAAKVDASYENGILEITLPKVEAAKPKKVAVKGKETKAK